MSKLAKLFQTGGSQAVRLPADCRFDGDAVYVRRDPLTGDVILSSKPPQRYATFMAARDALGPIPEGFLSASERLQSTHGRDPFAKVVGEGLA